MRAMTYPFVLLFLCFSVCAFAGPYVEEGIGADDPAVAGWATGVASYVRSDADTAFSDPSLALGPAAGSVMDVVSLGDVDPPDDAVSPGRITLTFDVDIADGPGPDLAVFENGFGSYPDAIYAELAYVEVSTNGEVFARFPSLSTLPYEPGGYAFFDVSDCYHLAGKHPAGWGTPFDLSELAEDEAVLSGLVDLQDIRYVRLVDIPGYGTQGGAFAGYTDSQGRPIHDNWPTFDSGGFDLDAVAVLRAVETGGDDDDSNGGDPSTDPEPDDGGDDASSGCGG